MSSARTAWGYGLATIHDGGAVLDTWYPQPALGDRPADAAGSGRARGAGRQGRRPQGPPRGGHHRDRPRRRTSRPGRRLPASPPALAHASSRPTRSTSTACSGCCPTSSGPLAGPCAVDGFELTRAGMRARGPVQVFGVDKFPRMVDYVVPAGVRIGDADRVRLGAHLAPGTTVMHEGFVNFNAGTLGTSMVEGRISQGVVVGDGSDIGGGASTMGTLSGGGTDRVSIGERCLLGAESGLRHRARRRLRGRGRPLPHRRHQGHALRRPRGQGPRAVRPVQPAVPAQLRHRHRRGAARATATASS